uniref:Uncharacterized protein n=1 Tax=Tetranychus urticae TaxID=32264 RepID=T1KC60_TETUR
MVQKDKYYSFLASNHLDFATLISFTCFIYISSGITIISQRFAFLMVATIIITMVTQKCLLFHQELS